jgi:hypothetical protein
MAAIRSHADQPGFKRFKLSILPNPTAYVSSLKRVTYIWKRRNNLLRGHGDKL